MPEGNPQFGEVWTMRDTVSNRDVIGIVAEANEQLVILVSLTGNRVRFPGSRLFGWRFSQDMPTNVPQCARRGCANTGFLRYSHHGPNEYVCPRHLPMGVTAEIVRQQDEYVAPTSNPFVCPCPNCQNPDIVEDLRLNRIATGQWGLWTCLMCSYRWAVIGVAPEVLARSVGSTQWYHDTLTEMVRQLGIHGFTVAAIEMLSGAPRLPTEARYNGILATQVDQLPVPEAVVLLRLSNRQGRGERVPTTPRRPIQRLGGQPNRVGAGEGRDDRTPQEAWGRLYQQAEAPGPPIDLYREVPISRLRLPSRAQPSEEAVEQEVLVSVPEGSRWTQRPSGSVVEVERVAHSQDGEPVIRYRKLTDEPINPTMTMLRRDFLAHHTPFILPDSAAPTTTPPIDVSPGDEWESPNGDIILIATVDPKREMVHAEERASKRRRLISFVEFTNGRWRKIVRRTIYDRLMQDEEEDT